MDLSSGSPSAADCALITTLVASRRATTRAALALATGLSRSTVSQRLDTLFAADLLYEAEESQQSGGRPAKVLALNREFGVVIGVDVGEDHARVAVLDLHPKVLVERAVEVSLSDGPDHLLKQINDEAHALLAELGRPTSSVLGIGLALPAPVDFARGRVVGFSVLSGWDGFDIAGWFARHLDVPVLADNDVNLLALAEHRQLWPDADSLFFVKAGTGIGSGILNGGALYRGAQGAAGDIGHIQLDGHGDPLCRCGNVGCVEALAAGWALVRDLKGSGFPVESAADVVALAVAGEPEALQRVRAAGRILGRAVAQATSLLNPAVIVIGGALAQAGDPVLAGVREMVYQRSLPLATRELQIATTGLAELAGVLGAAHLVVDSWLEPAALERMLAGG
jgi:predicted NBD/HSP70 family sugar kinase